METTPAVLVAAMRAHLFDVASAGELLALSRYLATDFRAELRRAEEAIADALPALTPEDFRKLANGDSAVRGEIERFRDARWSLVDVSELRLIDENGNDGDDGTGWTILRGSSRFEVREVPRYVAVENKAGAFLVWDNEANERADVGVYFEREPAEQEAARMSGAGGEDPVYLVWDTEEDERASAGRGSVLRECGHDSYDTDEEDSARAACEAANVEDYRTNANGWPFAHNYAAAIDERDADDFDAAGFVVARHEPSGQVYAGIDGGGYDFLEAHWSRVYLRILLGDETYRDFGGTRYDGPTHIYVPTRDGLRRVVRGE